MIENEQHKRLRESDCIIDWKHYPVEEEDGSITLEDWSANSDRVLREWMEDECSCDAFSLANREKCYMYYLYHRGYDRAKYEEYAKQRKIFDTNTAFWGLTDMINDGWLKSPAFVDWNDMGYCVSQQSIKNFLLEIFEPQQRVVYLSFLIKNAELVYGSWKKEVTPILNQHLLRQKAEAENRQKELKRQAAEERAKNKQPKEKPEYTLSVDEIIQYVRNAGSHTASAISDMLRYFAFEKDGWKKDVIKKKLRLLDTPLIVQGDLVQGNKNEANFQVPVGQANQNVELMNTNKE